MRKFLLSSYFARFFLYLWGILKRLTKNKKMIFSKIAALITKTVEFENNELETAVETVLNAAGAVQVASLEVDRLAGTDNPEYTEQAGALVDLAYTLGQALPDLTEDQAAEVKATLALIIKSATPEAETALETLFNVTVDAVSAIQKLNDIADLENAPAE